MGSVADAIMQSFLEQFEIKLCCFNKV